MGCAGMVHGGSVLDATGSSAVVDGWGAGRGWVSRRGALGVQWFCGASKRQLYPDEAGREGQATELRQQEQHRELGYQQQGCVEHHCTVSRG